MAIQARSRPFTTFWVMESVLSFLLFSRACLRKKCPRGHGKDHGRGTQHMSLSWARYKEQRLSPQELKERDRIGSLATDRRAISTQTSIISSCLWRNLQLTTRQTDPRLGVVVYACNAGDWDRRMSSSRWIPNTQRNPVSASTLAQGRSYDASRVY